MSGEDYENGRPRGEREGRLPQWLPQGARHYLAHTTEGRSIRGLARNSGLHPSTVLRQVRRYETRRDDPLIDDALSALAEQIGGPRAGTEKETMQMERKSDANQGADLAAQSLSESRLRSESLRILRRLVETGAVLAVGRDMDTAVVVRDAPDGSTTRSAVVDRAVAQAMALRDWIACHDPGARVARYHITAAGRSALRDLGPGLGDVALRCCCLLEGLETTEQRLGWAARSGKIVLRIALQRLARHYEEQHGRFGPLIG